MRAPSWATGSWSCLYCPPLSLISLTAAPPLSSDIPNILHSFKPQKENRPLSATSVQKKNNPFSLTWTGSRKSILLSVYVFYAFTPLDLLQVSLMFWKKNEKWNFRTNHPIRFEFLTINHFFSRIFIFLQIFERIVTQPYSWFKIWILEWCNDVGRCTDLPYISHSSWITSDNFTSLPLTRLCHLSSHHQ